jgi:opacity protein-like surface antigen
MIYCEMGGDPKADRSVPMSVRLIIAGLSAAALAVATISPALADDHRRHHHHGNNGYEHNSHGNGHYSNNRHNNGHNYNNGYSYNYNNGYYDSYGNYRQHHRSNDNGTALGVGLGIVGLAVVLGAMNSGNKNRSRDDRQERRDDRYDRDGWYRGEANHNGDSNWRNPDDFAYRSYQGSTPQFSANQCLETREYQTRISVGGRSREAYGTSCLMRNGQWVQSPPQLVPEGR